MFLTIVTRTHRPQLLKLLIQSLDEQTERDFKHLIIEDKEMRGAGWANVRLRTVDVDTDYIWAVDDDDVLTDANVIRDLKKLAGNDYIIVPYEAKLKTGSIVLPKKGDRLKKNRIGGSCVVVSKNLWYQHREKWGDHQEGDWDFLTGILNYGNYHLKRAWFDRVGLTGTPHGGGPG